MTTIIIVQNSLCDGCVDLINSELSIIKNISDVQVDTYSSEIMFNYSNEKDLYVAKKKLKSLGFPEFNDHTLLFFKIKSLMNCTIRRLKYKRLIVINIFHNF